MTGSSIRDFSKLAFSASTQLGVAWAILRGFMSEFGVIKGLSLFGKTIFSANKTKQEILACGENVPQDKVLDLAATALSAYRVLFAELKDNQETHKALRKVYVDPYSTYMCKKLMSSLDAEFKEVVTFFDWGFGLFAPWIERKQLRTDDDHYDFDITRCQFANIFTKMGCPEVTPVICAMDIGLYHDLNKITMARTGTIGMGSDHCDFRFSRTEKKDH